MTSAVFSPSPIGAQLALAGAARAVTTLADSLSRDRVALGNVVAAAAVGVEMVWSGDGSACTIGVQPGSVVSAELGQSSNVGSYGWRLDAGTLSIGGANAATGLPVPDKGEAVGMRLDLDAKTLQLYVGRTLVHTVNLTTSQAAESWRFGVSLGSTTAGDCTVTINTGGAGASTPALIDGGWSEATASPTTLRLASEDWLTGTDDSPANARYEGSLDARGIDLVSSISFWPWASSGSGSAGEIPVLDFSGRFDGVGDDADAGVTVKSLTHGSVLSTATALGRYTLRAAQVGDDMQQSLKLGDALAALDDPLPRETYLPAAGALAWKPQPIVIGACRNVPLAAINSDGSLQWVSDAPTIIRGLRERGRALTRDTDWTPDRSRQAVQLVSPPVSTIYADLSSTDATGADIWGGGVAHAGTLGGSTSTLAAGGAAQYTFTASVPAGGRLILSLADDTAGAILAVEHSGTYTGALVNSLATAATLYFLGEGGATVSSVTLKPLSDVASGPVPTTLAGTLREVFRRARFGAWSLSDASAIDTATGYTGIGLYAGDTTTARTLYRRALASYCAADWQDGDGTLRFVQLASPADGTPTFALDENDMLADLEVHPDMAPNLTTRMSWRPNIKSLAAGDISTDTVAVPAWRRAQLMAEAQGTVWSGVQLAARYAAFAAAADPMPSRFDVAADAQAEIDRVCGLYTIERHFFTLALHDLTARYRPGQIGTITYVRRGLAGKPVLVTRVHTNPVTGDTELTCWG